MAELEKLIFYNEYGNGDIFESREFVEELYAFFNPAECYYAHGKDPHIIKDMEFLTSIPFDHGKMDSMKPFIIDGDTLYINTWIGRDGKYVLPGIGCTVEKLHEMYNEILMMLDMKYELKKPPTGYIPMIKFLKYDIQNICEFVTHHQELMVLISNGPVQSNQAYNFDFTPVVDRLCDEFKDVSFIVTSQISLEKPNLYFTWDIIKSDKGCDLNEIGYLSTFCNIVVGRSSGPQVFAQHHDNYVDSNKTNISFTYECIASHFVLTKMPMKLVWSGATKEDDVFTVIKTIIER